ncbi:MAG: UDP-N-acetylmuramoyl-tripeptide--D-alanyl-D-alanine ligase [Candidatus Portnoybacteria bacterium]|nr:UDP-N-acetylmuramoyl-tripeptide--D-alanyl-D-alanine ligase [Candidatus Portnoybacteria bacterium]
MFKGLTQFILRKLASAALRKYRPIIIGVTGNMGKTSAKEAIFAVLNEKYKTRRNIKNYNNEIGVPLTILGLESGGRSPFKWLANIFRALNLIYSENEYPEVLVLEMGADKPGDIKYLMSFIDCKIGVITGIGDIPVHIEFFKSPEQVAREKSKLIGFLKEDDFAVLNFDDERVRNLTDKTKAKILSYGFSDTAKVRATNYALDIVLDPESAGASFKVEYNGKTIPFKKEGILGQHQIYALLAGISVGLAMGMNLIEVLEGFKKYQPPKGRMKLLEGIKNTWIIDDTYNASPSATSAALETLFKFEGRRKIAVLGDMLELGEFMEKAHRLVGEKSAQNSDLFFAVGERMKFAADEAHLKGMSSQKIFTFDTAQAAKMALQMTIQKGDIILVKGSQGMRMEKIVEEIMAHPENAKELLVRQEEGWRGR